MRLSALAPASCVIVALGACTGTGPMRSDVTVVLESRSGSAVSGVMRFSERGGKLRLRGTVRGLAANSEHGFHIHEKADCSAADASSAGGHFNPGGTAHGNHSAPIHHAGDLPSLKADATGVAKIDVQLDGATLGEGATSVRGRSLVVHGNPDDFTTQPSGNSGPRVACGVI